MTKRPSFTPAQRLDTFKAYGAIVVCQAKGCDSAIYISEAEIDHHQALIDGGKHELSNWRPICSACHRKKSAHEHKENSRSKRRRKDHEFHLSILKGESKREPGRLRSRNDLANRKLKKRFDGSVAPR